MNEESYTESATAAFLSNDIQRPPRNAPSDSEGVVMILSGEYYLDAHRGCEIICHQVWTGKTDRGINKVIIWSNQGHGWISGCENTIFTTEEARRCWNHAVDNGATRVYMRVKTSKSSKYDSVYEQWKSTSKYYNYDEDYKSYEELAKEERMWENYALEA